MIIGLSKVVVQLVWVVKVVLTSGYEGVTSMVSLFWVSSEIVKSAEF